MAPKTEQLLLQRDAVTREVSALIDSLPPYERGPCLVHIVAQYQAYVNGELAVRNLNTATENKTKSDADKTTTDYNMEIQKEGDFGRQTEPKTSRNHLSGYLLNSPTSSSPNNNEVDEDDDLSSQSETEHGYDCVWNRTENY